MTIAKRTRSKNIIMEELSLPSRKRIKRSWIPVTKTRNYMLNDHLVDWFKKNISLCSNNRNQFTDFLKGQGIKFEDHMIKYINNNIHPVVTVCSYYSRKQVNETKRLMRLGTPIIHSAPIYNFYNNTYGIVDLLVRSDFINLLTCFQTIPREEEHIKAPKLCGDYHYRVIDIKYSTLHLRCDGVHMTNGKNVPAYKAQLLLYTKAISWMQGYNPQKAYILGRRWRYKSKGKSYQGNSALGRLGLVDFSDVDNSYLHRTYNALKWVRDVQRNGSRWSMDPPSRIELYPNMCISSGKWDKIKSTYANTLGEITNVWNCGVKERKHAFQLGITSWKDIECTSKTLGFNQKGKRAPVVDKILQINQQNNILISPSELVNIKIPPYTKDEMFVDFETLGDFFSDFDQLPHQPNTEKIFMIGVWCNNSYTSFKMNKNTPSEERRIMKEFIELIESKGNPPLYFWCAEKRIWNRAAQRTRVRYVDNWVDLCDLFKKEPIVINGCISGFGLKAIAEAMRNHGFIDTQIESSCDSGIKAMVRAWKMYKDGCMDLDDIELYNTFDCKVMYDILSFLRGRYGGHSGVLSLL